MQPGGPGLPFCDKRRLDSLEPKPVVNETTDDLTILIVLISLKGC